MFYNFELSDYFLPIIIFHCLLREKNCISHEVRYSLLIFSVNKRSKYLRCICGIVLWENGVITPKEAFTDIFSNQKIILIR